MDNKEGIEALFLHATEGILIVNEAGEIIKFNPSAEKLFGYSQKEILSKKIETLIPKRFNSSHSKHREMYNINPHARAMGAEMELYGLKKNGEEFPVEISLSPYSNSEGKFVIAFIVDISLRKQAEEKLKNYSQDLEKQVKNRTLILEEAIHELERTKRDLNHSLKKEKDLNELKSRFVSMASHEFRTPLTTMMSSLSLVTKYGDLNDKENQNKHVNKIKNSIGNLTEILNDLLSISKLEEGKIDFTPSIINVDEFISDTLTELKAIVKERQQITYKHSGEKSASLDKKLLKNILLNLISNAIKFSPPDSIIEVTSENKPTVFKISVKDSGIGISKEDQKRLFERFFRGHNATHIQGTGLGLNIVSKYLELMNGTINFVSEENVGTTFIINIPK